mgnify:CR=1 FL=1
MRALVLSLALLLTIQPAAAQYKHGAEHTSELRISTPKMKDSGVLNKGAVRRALKRKFAELTSCHTPAMPAGNVVVDLSIDRDGLVSSVRARGVSTNVAACVQGVIDGIRFPLPKATVKTRVTLTYRVARPRP